MTIKTAKKKKKLYENNTRPRVRYWINIVFRKQLVCEYYRCQRNTWPNHFFCKFVHEQVTELISSKNHCFVHWLDRYEIVNLNTYVKCLCIRLVVLPEFFWNLPPRPLLLAKMISWFVFSLHIDRESIRISFAQFQFSRCVPRLQIISLLWGATCLIISSRTIA